MKDVVDIKAWKRKRSTTLFVYMLISFLTEFEKSANTATLWIYLTKYMKTNKPDLYYGLISASVYILPSLFSSVVAKLADKTRRIKLIIIITNFVAMVGCIFYAISWSPLFPFLGKFLNGSVIILRPLVAGEIARSYPAKEVPSKMAYLIFSASIGFMIGPCVVLPFAELDIRFGKLQIGYGNISAIFLLGTTIVIQLCVVFFVHDLSREYDLKEAESINHSCDVSNDGDVNVLKRAFNSKIMLILFTLTFFSTITSVSYGRNFPVLVLHVLQMSYKVISVGFTASAIVVIILCIVSIKSEIEDASVYCIGILGQASVITMLICQYIFVHFYLTYNIKIAMLVLYLATACLFEMGEQLFLVTVFSKLVSSQHQIYLESWRGILKQVGSILGALLSLVLLKSASIYAFLFVNVILLFLLCFYRHNLIHPVVQV